MNKAYKEVFDKLDELMRDDRYHEAAFIVNEELSQAYIPRDVEEALNKYKSEITYQLSDAKEIKKPSLTKILNMLKGNDKSQLIAANYLYEMDLRAFLLDIKDYLAKDPCPEAASYIIDAIALQGISDEFIYKKNGVEYTFYGDAITPVSQSEGFLKAMDLLNEYLGNDYPYLLQFTKPSLTHYAYTLLPLEIDVDEANDIVLKIIEDISNIVDEGKTYKEIIG